MKIKLKDENKMSRYLAWRLGRKIEQEEISSCFKHIKEFAESINKKRNDNFTKDAINIELKFLDQDYDIWVMFENIIENNEKIMLVDFNYSYESEVCGIPFY